MDEIGAECASSIDDSPPAGETSSGNDTTKGLLTYPIFDKMKRLEIGSTYRAEQGLGSADLPGQDLGGDIEDPGGETVSTHLSAELPDIVKSNTPPSTPTSPDTRVLRELNKGSEEETLVQRNPKMPRKYVSFDYCKENQKQSSSDNFKRSLSESGARKRSSFLSSGYGTGDSSVMSSKTSRDTDFSVFDNETEEISENEEGRSQEHTDSNQTIVLSDPNVSQNSQIEELVAGTSENQFPPPGLLYDVMRELESDESDSGEMPRYDCSGQKQPASTEDGLLHHQEDVDVRNQDTSSEGSNNRQLPNDGNLGLPDFMELSMSESMSNASSNGQDILFLENLPPIATEQNMYHVYDLVENECQAESQVPEITPHREEYERDYCYNHLAMAIPDVSTECGGTKHSFVEKMSKSLNSKVHYDYFIGLFETEAPEECLKQMAMWNESPTSSVDDSLMDYGLSVEGGEIHSVPPPQPTDPERLPGPPGTGCGVVSLQDMLQMASQCQEMNCKEVNCIIGREYLHYLHTALSCGRGFSEPCLLLLKELLDHAESFCEELSCRMPFCGLLQPLCDSDLPVAEILAMLIRERYPSNGQYHLIGLRERGEISNYHLLSEAEDWGLNEESPPKEGVHFFPVTRLGITEDGASGTPSFSGTLFAKVAGLPRSNCYHEYCVIKTMKYSKATVDTLQCLKGQDHPNVLKPIWCMQIDVDLAICTPFQAGSLYEVIRAEEQGLPPEMVHQVLRDLLSGLQWLHDQGIVYLLWTAKSILVSATEQPLLGDFSCAMRIEDVEEDEDLVGDAQHMLPPHLVPPEMFDFEVMYSSDVWGVACLAWEMATGSHVHSFIRHKALDEQRDIVQSSTGPPENFTAFTDQILLVIFQQCWERTPEERGSIRSLKDTLRPPV